jgi:hypothetical protein
MTGVRVMAGNGNVVSENNIYDNGTLPSRGPSFIGLGIDLGDATEEGVTPNDPTDSDDGANFLQNYPLITSASNNGSSLTVSGSVPGASGTYVLEFFANSDCDPSGYGEGETFLGSAEVELAPEDPSFSVMIPTKQSAAGYLTVTATDEGDNTSEFSECFDYPPPPPLCPAHLTGPGGVPDGQVNVSDLFLLLANWNTAGPGATLAPPDDIVNTADLFVLLAAWGPCPAAAR